MREWIRTMPNEGLFRYYIVANVERVVLTSPKALSELLVTKNYDFEKPLTVRQSLRRVVGDGILLAEGDEHKVPTQNAITYVDRYLLTNNLSSNEKTSCLHLPTVISKTCILSSGPRAWRWSS